MEDIVRGSLVWGQWKSKCWWPAIVLSAEDCGRDGVANNNMWLFWFGDHMISEVNYKNIVKFEENYSNKFNSKRGKKYHQAIEESLTVSATRHNVMHENHSSLFQWAINGFQNSAKSDDEIYVLDLPEIVLRFLNQDAFQRNELSNSDSETEINSLVSSVADGSKNLEDICISCCKSSAKVVIQHPLFLGGVCFPCKKNVDRISHLSIGCIRDSCILCGQGGDLVICSNVLCFRSFCKLCIEYLAPNGSFSKILQDKNWFCYVCKSDPSKNCLIKVRKMFEAKKPAVIPIPNKKTPMNIISHSNKVISILENKKIDVGKYCIFDTKNLIINIDNQEMKYKDMSHKKFAEIAADFVCGGYFVPYVPQDCRRKSVTSFFVDFYGYFFCLSHAKVAKSSALFIYISVAEIFDDMMFSTVLRFLEIDPISVKCDNQLFSVWTNIPNYSSIKSRTLSLKKKSVQETAEECLFSYFIEPLKCYFKQLP